MKKLFGYLAIVLLFASCEKEIEIIDSNTNNPGTLQSELAAQNPFKIYLGDPSLVIAHRGGASLKPENTMLAFNNAANLNVDVLEMDVVLTKDNILVTNHDVTINSTSDTSGNVSDFTFQELQQFNFGYNFQAPDGSYPCRVNPVRIPRLEDVFIQHPDELMSIEIKDLGNRGKLAADILQALISNYNMASKVMVFSFANDVMARINVVNSEGYIPGAAIGESLSLVNAAFAGTDSLLTVNADVFVFPTELIGLNLTSDTVIDAIHRQGAAVHYWTINDKSEMKSLILKGADGIITNEPILLQEALTELGF